MESVVFALFFEWGVRPFNAAPSTYKLLSHNRMLKPRLGNRSFGTYAGAMRGRYFVCSDASIAPRDQVRPYPVVKGERESFVTEEEGSLRRRRECYADG